MQSLGLLLTTILSCNFAFLFSLVFCLPLTKYIVSLPPQKKLDEHGGR